MRRYILSVLFATMLVASMAMPAFAFNPQPDPPGERPAGVEAVRDVFSDEGLYPDAAELADAGAGHAGR